MFKTIGSVRVSILLIILSVFPNADLLLSWDFFELFNIIGTLGLSEIAALAENTQYLLALGLGDPTPTIKYYNLGADCYILFPTRAIHNLNRIGIKFPIS